MVKFIVPLVHKKLLNVVNKIGKREVPYYIFVRYLNKEFRFLSVKFRSMPDRIYNSNFINVTGYYSGNEKDEGERRYNIQISYPVNAKKLIPIESHDLMRSLFCCILHEIKHGQQDQKRKYKKRPYIANHRNDMEDYFSDYDELDAYAFEVGKSYSIRKLDNSWVCNTYREIFAETNPKIYNKFLKKVYLYNIEYPHL